MKLFLGLIFILVDFQIRTDAAVIGLLPDFVGFYLLMKGLEERDDSWRHLAFGLTLAAVVLFAADLFEKAPVVRVGFWCAGLGLEAVSLVLLHHIVRGEKRLRELFPVLAGIRVVCCALSWLPMVGTVCMVANLAVSVCFLAAAWGPLTKKR